LKGKIKLVDAREMGTKMRKSLGDKRKELTTDAISEITHLYSDALTMKKDSRIKVMANEELGYARLTIERPLRRIWRCDENTLLESPGAIRGQLESLVGKSFTSLNEATSAVASIGLEGKDAKLAIKLLATTDPLAKPLTGKKSEFEPDAELRDFENIALPEGFISMSTADQESKIQELAEFHLKQEVLPYVADAWIDHSKTKIGYEIPFTRQFYTYEPPRLVSDVRLEIEKLELEIQDLMNDLG
jgi:type I restriction enzyme M protein